MLNNMRENEATEMTELMDRVRTECAEHSPAYSNNTAAWSWNLFSSDTNYGDSSNELSGLVEDKDIAARAVAFVVNSTRKGIIPLCADVAHLMRSKQCLERKLYMLKKETDAFRSSASAASLPSHSMSPTPPSLSSYTENCIKALQEQSLAVQQDLYRSNSRCSNSSSTYSYSPKMDKPRGGTSRQFGVQYSPVTDHDNRNLGLQSNRFIHSVNSGFQRSQPTHSKHCQDKKYPNPDDPVRETEGTKCKKEQVGAPPVKEGNAPSDCKVCISTNLDGDPENIDVSTLPEYTNAIGNMVSALHVQLEDETSTKSDGKTKQKDKSAAKKDDAHGNTAEKPSIRTLQIPRSLLERRRVSLPEMTSLPSDHVIRIRPKQSKQVQCSMVTTESDQALEDQFVHSVRLNTKLEEELNEARKEIEHLKSRLMRIEATGAIPKIYSGYGDDDKSTEDNGYYTGSNRTSRNSSEHEKSSGMFKSPKRQTTMPVSYTGPLASCKCSGCQEAIGSEDDLSHYCDQYLEEPTRYAVNSKLQVQIGDHVTTKTYKSGYIRYIGHVDKLTNQTNSLFIGLETDDQVGNHDGFYRGKRYFYCKDKHGVFIPMSDVVGKVSKKQQNKTSKEEYLKLKKHTRKPSTRDDKTTPL